MQKLKLFIQVVGNMTGSCGISNPMKGNTHALGYRWSEERIKKHSDFMKEYWRNHEHPSKKKRHSTEAKLKMSESHRGKKHSKKTKRKMSESRKGKQHSKESKGKTSKSMKQQWVSGRRKTRRKSSEETKRRQSETGTIGPVSFVGSLRFSVERS